MPQAWKNIHENISFDVERYCEIWNRDANDQLPATFVERWKCGVANIKKLLGEARVNNKKVRAIGGGWSLSDIQQTTDYFVNLNPLNLIRVGLKPEHVKPGVDGSQYCFCQGGASVLEVNEELRKKSMALPTSGASDGQSIVGAFTTGTHGSSFTYGSMPDMVEALHIIVSDTVHYWVEGSQQIMNDQFINDYVAGATRINDDDILNSAIVSFGSFGIIHGVVLKVVPIYELEAYQKYVSWNDLKPSINGPSNIGQLVGIPDEDIYFFSVVANPYRMDSMIVSVMKKVPYKGHPQPTDDQGFGISNDILHVIGKVQGIIPNSVPTIMVALDKTLKSRYPEYKALTNIPGWIFCGGMTAGTGKALSVELGVDASNVLAAADIIFNLCKTTPYPGVISFRYVKQTKTTLGFTKYPMSCAVEFPAVFSSQTQKFYDEMYALLDAAGIEYTFHWGQCNNLDSVNVRKKYGDAAVDTWIKARHAILKTHEQQKMFSNDFMHRLGLDKLSVEEPALA